MKIRFAMINDVFIPYLNDIRSLVILPKYCPKGYEVELECVGSFNIDPTIEPKLQDIFTEKNYGSYKGYARQYKYVDPAIAGELYIEADGNFNSDKLQRFLVDCIRVYKEDLSPFFELYDKNKIIITENKKCDVDGLKKFIESFRSLMKKDVFQPIIQEHSVASSTQKLKL